MDNANQKPERRSPGPEPFAGGKVTFITTKEQEPKLQAYCKRYGRTRSDVMREALDMFLEIGGRRG